MKLPESDDLGGTDEGEVRRVEDDDEVFAVIVGEADLLEGSIGHVSLGLDLRGLLSGLKHLVAKLV